MCPFVCAVSQHPHDCLLSGRTGQIHNTVDAGGDWTVGPKEKYNGHRPSDWS